jgi:hypothetical protein
VDCARCHQDVGTAAEPPDFRAVRAGWAYRASPCQANPSGVVTAVPSRRTVVSAIYRARPKSWQFMIEVTLVSIGALACAARPTAVI